MSKHRALLLLAAGALSVVAGVALIFPPAGLIVGGVGLGVYAWKLEVKA